MPTNRPVSTRDEEERSSGGGEAERDRDNDGEREAVPNARAERREEA